MAIFDSEKRPRGLRVPSLTAMKSGAAASKSLVSLHKKSSDTKTSEKEITPVPTRTVQPTRTAQPSLSTKPAPPSNKELPPPPKDELPPRPRMPTAVPRRRDVPKREVSNQEMVSPRDPWVQDPLEEQFGDQFGEQLIEQPREHFREQPREQPREQFREQPREQPREQFREQPREQPREQFREVPTNTRSMEPPVAPRPIRPTVTAPALMSMAPQSPPEPRGFPSTLSPPPDRQNRDSGSPLEDFIPTPEPEAAENPLDSMSSNEQTGPYTPPDFEPVAAPLSRVHFVCFQDHRAMPIAQNEWCPLPCQTCHKFDREIRHRCVFCCLRVCESCYQGLQKGPNRSLAELMKTLNFD